MNRTALALLCALHLPGCPDCDYESRCDGDTLKTCSVGVDQMVGDPSEARIACEGENPVCVDIDAERAQCVRPGKPTCGADFAERCEADLAVICSEGHEVAEDCAGAGNVCALVEGRAQCAFPPLESCDPSTWLMACDGDGLLICDAGLVSRVDCAAQGPFETCVLHRSEYGRSAYCGRE